MLAAIIAGFNGLAALGRAAEIVGKAYESAQQQELGDLRRLTQQQAETIRVLTMRLAAVEAIMAGKTNGGRL